MHLTSRNISQHINEMKTKLDFYNNGKKCFGDISSSNLHSKQNEYLNFLLIHINESHPLKSFIRIHDYPKDSIIDRPQVRVLRDSTHPFTTTVGDIIQKSQI